MVRAAIAFLVLAIFAYLLGLYGVAGLSIEIGKFLLIAFIALSILSFIASLFTKRGTSKIT
ncbi:MAG: DUF1328 family protein [Bacteriovoracaceae bacterium]